MSIVVNREYREIENHKIECYTLDGELILDPTELITKLQSKGINIRPAQMKFIATKHKVPRELYEKYGFQYNDKVSGIPTEYPTEGTSCDPIENSDSLVIQVRIYKVGGFVDHCDYQVDDKRYIRLGKLYKDLDELGFHFSSMQQLRNCIHREISNNLRARYPNLTISTEIIEE